MHSRRPTVEYDLKLMNFSCSGKCWEYDHLRDVIKVRGTNNAEKILNFWFAFYKRTYIKVVNLFNLISDNLIFFIFKKPKANIRLYRI